MDWIDVYETIVLAVFGIHPSEEHYSRYSDVYGDYYLTLAIRFRAFRPQALVLGEPFFGFAMEWCVVHRQLKKLKKQLLQKFFYYMTVTIRGYL